MPLDANSKAAAVGTGAENKQFAPSAQNVPRKAAIIGLFDPSITTVVPGTPQLVTSAEQVGALTGFGFPLHRLAKKFERGSNGIEMWISPTPEDVAAAQSEGNVDFAGSVPEEAGTMPLYVAAERVPVSITLDDDGDTIAQKFVDAVNNDRDLPVTAAVDGVTTSQANLTAKAGSAGGDDITLTAAWGFQEEIPAGVVVSVTEMTGGAGAVSLEDNLKGLGINDNQNERNWTAVVLDWTAHAFDTGLAEVSAYNGLGNLLEGDFDKIVARPFRCLSCAPREAVLGDIVALTDAYKLDRTNGILAAPNSPAMMCDISATVMGIMESINNNRAAENYTGRVVPDIIPGLADEGSWAGERWTDDYNARDLAVKSGISPLFVENGFLTVQNVQSFYRPDSVPSNSNGWASQRNMSVTQNILFNHKANFNREEWKGNSVVADVTKVTNSIDREKVKDRDAVLDDLLALADAYEGRGWIFSAAWTKEKLLSEPWRVALRPDALGFNTFFPVQYSGELQILDNLIEFDVAISTQL